jgi:DNA-binding transcriptional LysR family regulator
MVELRQIKYFVRIAELEHFGQAAEDLHIVQPALSRQIKQLEAELEVELFERLPRGVRLTSAGQVLLQRSRPLLQELERTLAATKLASQGKLGSLRIGFADGTTYSGHLPQVIGSFRSSHADVELELIPERSIIQAKLLAENAIDAAFVYWLPRDRSNIDFVPINKERVVLAMAKNNKLTRKKSLRLADLQDSSFIWIKRDNSPMFYDLILSQCNQAGLTLNVVQEATTESSMLSLVSADMGVTFITETAQRRKPDNVELRPVKDLTATITLMAMWRKDDRNPALREFLDEVRKLS